MGKMKMEKHIGNIIHIFSRITLTDAILRNNGTLSHAHRVEHVFRYSQLHCPEIYQYM